MRERFDLESLDPDDLFELDRGNLPHLAKHAPFAAQDVLDAWTFGDPRRCRPIGIYEPSRSLIERYEEDSRR